MKKNKREQEQPEYDIEIVRGYGPVIKFRSEEERNAVLRKEAEDSEKASMFHLEALEQAECLRKNNAVAELQKIGFFFKPSDEVLVNYYLKNKTLGTYFGLCPIDEVDVYANHPQTLKEKFNSNCGVWYFFTKSRPNENPDVDGQWEFGEKNDIFDNGVKVGVRQELEFNGNGDQNGNGKYKIIEYQLDPVVSAPLFVCKLYDGVEAKTVGKLYRVST